MQDTSTVSGPRRGWSLPPESHGPAQTAGVSPCPGGGGYLDIQYTASYVAALPSDERAPKLSILQSLNIYQADPNSSSEGLRCKNANVGNRHVQVHVFVVL